MSDYPEQSTELPSGYYDPDLMADRMETRGHRGLVGGRWDELGPFQLEALIGIGLEPHHRLLDAGCGSLRAGRHIVDYLDPGHYFGTDLNESLLDAGWANELTPDQQARLPRSNLATASVTDPVPFSETFDYALAFSLFSHLPGPICEDGLARVARSLRPGGVFMATFFLTDGDINTPREQTYRIHSYPDRDPFHFTQAQVIRMAARAGFAAARMPNTHPRNQILWALTRTDAPVPARKATRPTRLEIDPIPSEPDALDIWRDHAVTALRRAALGDVTIALPNVSNPAARADIALLWAELQALAQKPGS